jgi:hypothetical protein
MQIVSSDSEDVASQMIDNQVFITDIYFFRKRQQKDPDQLLGFVLIVKMPFKSMAKNMSNAINQDAVLY